MTLHTLRVDPTVVVATLFWSAVVTSGLGFLLDRYVRGLVRINWRQLLGILVLVLLWRVPVGARFFHGLEYEDSYVYTVAGRQLYERVLPPASTDRLPYAFDVCALGSLQHCERSASYPEHLIGYPYMLAGLCHLVGYSLDVGSLLNLLFACLSAILIFLSAVLLTNDRVVAISSAGIFAVLPVFAVNGLETSAEPALNFCICVLLWFFLRLAYGTAFRERAVVCALYWTAFNATLLFSQCVKREAVLLSLVLPLSLAACRSLNGRNLPRLRMFLWLSCSTALSLLLCFHMKLIQTTAHETNLAREFPLTGARLWLMVTGFLRSFAVLHWYVGTFAATAVGMVVSLRRRDLTVIPVVTLLAYVAMYALHIRGYYELQANSLDPSRALRFSMSLMGLWALEAGVGIGKIVERVSFACRGRGSLLKPVLGLTALSFVAVSLNLTLRLRDYEDEDEQRSRVLPASAALDFAAGHSYVGTLEPLILQMYGATTDSVVDLETTSPSELRTVLAAAPRGMLLLEEASHQSEQDYIRYGPQTRFLATVPTRVLFRGDGYEILQICSRNR